MSEIEVSEGGPCPESNCDGTLELPPVENCSCHINPPCSACTNNPLTCPACDWEYEEPYTPPEKSTAKPVEQWKPRPLDNTKIDYRISSHTNDSQICEGVYPEGTTATEVLERVKGTFGGRFEHFGNGRFKYIAYTD